MQGDKVLEGFAAEDLKVEINSIYGAALLMRGAVIDSYQQYIDADAYYKLVRHLPTRKMFIIPLGETLRNDMMNEILKSQGKLN